MTYLEVRASLSRKHAQPPEPGYILTYHLRERYIERFSQKKRFSHLSECRRQHCQLCIDLTFDLREEVKSGRNNLDATLNARLRNAREECSYLNSSEFMRGMYERYGFDQRFIFLVDGDALFVILLQDGKKIVPTCIPSRQSIVGRVVSRPKYRKKPEKEVIGQPAKVSSLARHLMQKHHITLN